MARQSCSPGRVTSKHLETGSAQTPSREVRRKYNGRHGGARRGRPLKVTGSGKRKLARLYTLSSLTTPDMCRVLHKFSGIQIAERTVQNHLQDVLHTDLKSTRPQDRKECRERMTQMHRYHVTATPRRSRKHADNLERLTSSSSSFKMPYLGQIDVENFHMPDVESSVGAMTRGDVTASCDSSLRSLESSNDPVPALETADLPRSSFVNVDQLSWPSDDLLGSAEIHGDVNFMSDFEFEFINSTEDTVNAPEATESLLPDGAETTIALEESTNICPDLGPISTKISEQSRLSYMPEPELSFISLGEASLPIARPSQFHFDWVAMADDASLDRRPEDLHVHTGFAGHGWSGQSQRSNTAWGSQIGSSGYASLEAPQHPLESADGSSPPLPKRPTDLLYDVVGYSGDTINLATRHFLSQWPDTSHHGAKRSLSGSSSVLSGGLRSRQKLDPPTTLTIPEAKSSELSFGAPSTDHNSCTRDSVHAMGTAQSSAEPPSNGRRPSLTPSLNSYSSSQRQDIITILRSFSLSSRETKSSSLFTCALEHIDRTPQPQAVALDDLYAMKAPVDMPGQWIMSDVDTLKKHEACEYFKTWQQQSYWCIPCSGRSNFNAAVGDLKRWAWVDAGLAGLEIDERDRFDNTPLHVAAAAGADWGVLYSLVLRGVSLNAVNTAGQTFLHVLNPALLALSGHMPQFLKDISSAAFEFSTKDHQGLNVLQALLQHPLHHEVISKIVDALHLHLPSMASRDNLGRSVQSRLVYLAKYASADPERTQTINHILSKFYGVDPVFYNAAAFDRTPLNNAEEDVRTLEAMISRAIEEPGFEDAYGRNGLHCCAQLCIERTNERPKQSLRDKLMARAPTKARRASVHDHQPQSNQVIDLHFNRLLDAKVSVMSYDKTGNTPLLALLYHNTYSAKHNDPIIKKRMTDLIRAGASVHSRDRNGESPLHVAVKLGIITAIRVLMANGANLHARQRDGKGVVELGLQAADEMRSHKTLHIRIMTCINMLKGRGAVDRPTMFQEWDAR